MGIFYFASYFIVGYSLTIAVLFLTILIVDSQLVREYKNIFIGWASENSKLKNSENQMKNRYESLLWEVMEGWEETIDFIEKNTSVCPEPWRKKAEEIKRKICLIKYIHRALKSINAPPAATLSGRAKRF